MNLEKLRGEYKKARPAIKAALEGYKKANDYFYEMCFCLLTPQSNAKKCYEAITILKQKDFLNNNFNIKPILKTRTRFYNNKSRYLLELKNKYKLIQQNLKENSEETREFLVKEVKGLGYKES